MAQCKFCKKRFASAQGVRSHLKSCAPYRENVPRERVPIQGLPREPKAGGIAESAIDELQAERAKLDLRKIRTEHRRLDEEEAERVRRAREQKEAARLQAEAEARAQERERLAAEERRRREAAEAERRRERRKIIQRAKDHVDSAFAEGLIWVPGEVRAAMLAEVEQVLSGMPVDELSFSEVARSAEGVRTRHYRPVEEAHRQQQEAERRRAAAKARLVAHGQRHAEDRLDAEGVQGFGRLGVTQELGSALGREIEGTESPRDVEELVEGLLAPKIKQIRREAEDQRRQEEERERRQQEQERIFQQSARERQERADEARLAANRQRLARHGEFYALRVMNKENALADNPLERFQVARRIKEQLLDDLDGDESEEEIEGLVEEILDEELGESD